MYQITNQDGKARIGIIETPHGKINTPFYMPVATKGAVKFIECDEAKALGTQCLISNALINYFRPGLEILEKFGGLHNFMSWQKPLTTDSGGFQLLSDNFLVRTEKKGAVFRDPFTGKKKLITPKKLMQIQQAIGSDIAMVIDDVPRHDVSYDSAFRSMKNTHEWARECVKVRNKGQLLFGIAQGGMFKDLRKHSAQYISSLGFDGIALGGLAIGEPIHTMKDIINFTIDFLPEEKPRYLMGVGSPLDMLEAIRCGVDMFDSTFPTANARHNTAFTFKGPLKIKRFRDDSNPIEPGCDCKTCKNYSRAFVHHLMRTQEPVGKKLMTYHNLYFMHKILEEARKAIEEKRFESFYSDFCASYK
ncbi:MAG: tRNA guanosine(34) transglycosylase Tgt [Candidatus Woesearchaeota archaeon]